MATQTLNEADGPLNGTTEVTLIAGPSSGQRINKYTTIQNRDSATVTITVRKVSASGTRQIWKGDLAPGDTWELTEGIVLAASTSSIRAVMSAAATTTNPDYTSSWVENV